MRFSQISGFEALELGKRNDTVRIIDASDVTTIDASSETEGAGDIFDLSQLKVGATVDIQEEALEFSGIHVEVIDFETVLGSDHSDSITGNEKNSLLLGGDGADDIDGGAGDDVLVVDSSDLGSSVSINVSGGEGRDILYVDDTDGVKADMAALNVEVAVGNSGDDEFYMDASHGSQMVAGGAGDDIFAVWSTDEDGPAIIWGGAGADQFHTGGGNMIVASVSGLSTENFENFELDLLGLGEIFDWSDISAVIINSGSSDEFYRGMKYDFNSETMVPDRMGVGTHRSKLLETKVDEEDSAFIEMYPETTNYSLSEIEGLREPEYAEDRSDIHSGAVRFGDVSLNVQTSVYAAYTSARYWGPEGDDDGLVGWPINGYGPHMDELSSYEFASGAENGPFIDKYYRTHQSLTEGETFIGDIEFPNQISDLISHWSVAGGKFSGTSLVSNGQ
ncbi:hypothetical protein [Phaeobacter piscinae]|uniref:hypothetical protein n=1 Tax=Phaeobacter piscinae TaxID=1580596 RepID=UPI000C9C5787|nr:hypothetical protein [Phaeobacter piscinae]AUQ73762.1 Cyclolysin [Phaeobacter piscinae]